MDARQQLNRHEQSIVAVPGGGVVDDVFLGSDCRGVSISPGASGQDNVVPWDRARDFGL